jgi:hypothetical protein
MSKPAKKQTKLRKNPEKQSDLKGRKSVRGEPNNRYGELKKNITLSLTPTGRAGIDQACNALDITRSEFLEQIGRLPLSSLESVLAELAPSDAQTTRNSS